MSTERARFEPWLAAYLRPRHPELELPLMRAVDAFDAIQTSGRMEAEQLDAIVSAASSKRTPLCENASNLLDALSEKWPQVRDAILRMSRDKRAHVRFSAILCLGKQTPPAFVDSILGKGLVDKSSKVRTKAADWIERLGRKTLAPALADAMAAETYKPTREAMEFCLHLLRDGYFVRAFEDKHFSIVVRAIDGSIRSRLVEKAKIEALDVHALVAELQQKSY